MCGNEVDESILAYLPRTQTSLSLSLSLDIILNKISKADFKIGNIYIYIYIFFLITNISDGDSVR